MISVCIATYNGQAFIQDQLISVLSQLGTSDEVLVSDDGSSDNTIKIIRAIEDSRIKILPLSNTRLGIVKNFERTLSAASGDYIFLCDQDDIWLENKVNRTIESLRYSVLTVSDCKVVDANLLEVSPSFFALRNSGPGFIRNLYKNAYLGCCIAFRKELMSYILPFPQSAPMHDMWIGLIAQTVGRVSFIREPLVLYRRHGKNASSTAEKSNFSLYKQIKIRLVLCCLVILRYIRNTVR
ncbi:glycosyltransferase family 2 protein [Methylophilus flavus]|uniref:Glycosyltransferase family 2 protein n=1 Tax=Methylophilus flavus TaxID=640084 RepID=A0ABW3PAM1_9PROT